MYNNIFIPFMILIVFVLSLTLMRLIFIICKMKKMCTVVTK